MAFDRNLLRLPGVSTGLRRMAASDAGGYGSIASRFDPRNYGSILSRKYPGVFGAAAQPSGQDVQNAQTDQIIQNNQRQLTLRDQQAAFQRSPEDEALLRRQKLAYGLRRVGQQLNPQNPDLFGGDDEDLYGSF